MKPIAPYHMTLIALALTAAIPVSPASAHKAHRSSDAPSQSTDHFVPGHYVPYHTTDAHFVPFHINKNGKQTGGHEVPFHETPGHYVMPHWVHRHGKG